MDGHLTLLRLWRSRVYFRQLVWLSLSDVVMSWLRLQTPVKCIPHLYHMYTKCFNILICHGWAYGCALTLFYLCNKLGGDFRKIEGWLSPSDVVMSWLRREVHPASISYVSSSLGNRQICSYELHFVL